MFDAEFGRDLIAHESAKALTSAILDAANRHARTPTQSISEAIDRLEKSIRREKSK